MFKNFQNAKSAFQLFCFSTDFNFDYRFLEGMTGGIFEMWFWRLSETFFIFIFGVSQCYVWGCSYQHRSRAIGWQSHVVAFAQRREPGLLSLLARSH